LAAQYLLLYEMSLPYGLDISDRITLDKSAIRLSVTLKSLSSKEVLVLEQRAEAWLRQNALPSMQVVGSSPTIMFAHIGQRNIKSMLLGVSVALVAISLILIFALRSFKLGLISLIPNLVPVAMGFGLWGLMVGQIGFALSVVAAMALGIVVDDTVHFLSKYLRARREKGLDAEDAVRYAFSTVGTAIWVTSVVLIAGFSVLAFSSYEINAGLGLLTAIVIGMALLADFLLLPSLLLKLEEKKHETNTSYCPVPNSSAS
jgi:predicted RND superfamily exporter protein